MSSMRGIWFVVLLASLELTSRWSRVSVLPRLEDFVEQVLPTLSLARGIDERLQNPTSGAQVVQECCVRFGAEQERGELLGRAHGEIPGIVLAEETDRAFDA